MVDAYSVEVDGGLFGSAPTELEARRYARAIAQRWGTEAIVRDAAGHLVCRYACVTLSSGKAKVYRDA